MKKMRRVLVCVFLVLSLVGCRRAKSAQEDTQSQAKVSYIDSLGRTVEVPEDITRVVSSGSLAQIALYAIAPDSLVGISGAWSEDAADYVEEKYLNLPEIGQFFGQRDLNYEEIIKLNPQIIIDVGEEKTSMKEDLDEITKKTGIPAIHIGANIDTMNIAFEELGKLLGVQKQGQALASYSKNAYEEVVKMMHKVDKAKARKSLLYLTGENGLNVVAKNSYHASVIDLLSDNLAVVDNPSSKGSGNETDIEQLYKWNPEIIIFAPDSYYDYASEDIAFNQLTAIKTNNYVEVPNGPYNWMGFPPSSNRILGMLWMGQILYPDYTTYDFKKKIVEYYQLFYHCTLSDKQYNQLIEKSMLKKQ